MEFRDDIYLGITGIIVALAAYFALYVAPAEVTMGELVRVFYFHLPPAIICYLALLVSVVTGLIFIRTKDIKCDVL